VGTLRPFGHAPHGPRARPCAGHRGAEDRDAAAFGAGHLAAARDDAGGAAPAQPGGLAAGFDKNAEAIAPLSRAGFGFLEVGAATPRPQPGNAKPRLFRLTEDAAAINRFGFNNDGMEAIAARLAAAPRCPVGLNLGANKDSPDRAAISRRC
jgi:dihydroorotate dehydrogenase